MRLRLIVSWPARLWLRLRHAVIYRRVLGNAWRVAWYKSGRSA